MRKTSATRLILEIKNLKDKSKYPYEVGLVARLLENTVSPTAPKSSSSPTNWERSASGRCPERGSSTSTATSPRQNSKSGDMPEWITATLSSKPTNTGSPKHMLGLEVNVWTVNTREEMEYFLNLGVDYITTDEPELLQALIRERSGK